MKTTEEIRKFLALQQKTILDLSVICESIGVDPKGKEKAELISEVIAATHKARKVNHIIALASNKNAESAAILKAIRDEVTRQNQSRVFDVPTMDQSSYQEKLKFIPCSEDLIEQIRTRGLLYRKDASIYSLLEQADQFNAYFVIKPSGKNTWLMLFLESK